MSRETLKRAIERLEAAAPAETVSYKQRWLLTAVWLPRLDAHVIAARARGGIVGIDGRITPRSALRAGGEQVDIEAFGTADQILPLLRYLSRTF